jgi:hypothetical protein
LQPLFDDSVPHLEDRNPGILRASRSSESEKLILFTGRHFAVYQDKRFGPMIPGVDCLGDDGGVGRPLSMISGFESCGFVS